MRPRFFNRGEAKRHAQAIEDRQASMRPRFFNRGEDVALDSRVSLLAASMRPRFFNRGEEAYAFQSSGGALLQ